MSHKSGKIAELIAGCVGRDLDAHYLGYFECFNRQLYYEAHDVLEELWLPERKGPRDLFYKGLIQLAGAFVHLQKSRLKPSESLFKLARANLSQYPANYECLDVSAVLALIERWISALQDGRFEENPLDRLEKPVIALTGREIV